VPAAAAAETARRFGRTPRELAAAGAFNTLADASDAGRARLANVPFGEVLLDKWRGVASNRVEGERESVGAGPAGVMGVLEEGESAVVAE